MATLILRLHPEIRTPPDESSNSTPNGTKEGTGRYAQSGSLGHRMIGVVIVLGILVVAFTLWMILAKRPRRKLRSWGCTCLPAPREKQDGGEERYVGDQNGHNRPESWVISHEMEAHRIDGLDPGQSTFQTKRVMQEGVEEGNKIEKACELWLSTSATS